MEGEGHKKEFGIFCELRKILSELGLRALRGTQSNSDRFRNIAVTILQSHDNETIVI